MSQTLALAIAPCTLLTTTLAMFPTFSHNIISLLPLYFLIHCKVTYNGQNTCGTPTQWSPRVDSNRWSHVEDSHIVVPRWGFPHSGSHCVGLQHVVSRVGFPHSDSGPMRGTPHVVQNVWDSHTVIPYGGSKKLRMGARIGAVNVWCVGIYYLKKLYGIVDSCECRMTSKVTRLTSERLANDVTRFDIYIIQIINRSSCTSSFARHHAHHHSPIMHIINRPSCTSSFA